MQPLGLPAAPSEIIAQRLVWLRLAAVRHFARRWKWWVAYLGCIWVFTIFFKLGINATESLPQKLFLISKFERQIQRGDLIGFVWHGGGRYPKGWEFVKIVKGLPGDTVRFKDRKVYVNGEYLAEAKEFAKYGEPLELGPSGTIPAGKYFVFATHKDSLDSRYAITGWIDEKSVVGRAYGLF